MSAAKNPTVSKTSVVVMLAVNDPNNGNFADECTAVEIADLITVYERGEPLPVAIVPDQTRTRSVVQAGVLVVGDGRYRYWDYKYWVGNWCWDAVRMKVDAAARLLEQLRTKGWSYDEAETSLAEAWEKGEPLAPMLARLLAQGGGD